MAKDLIFSVANLFIFQGCCQVIGTEKIIFPPLDRIKKIFWENNKCKISCGKTCKGNSKMFSQKKKPTFFSMTARLQEIFSQNISNNFPPN
jgi:hypothetical protein